MARAVLAGGARRLYSLAERKHAAGEVQRAANQNARRPQLALQDIPDGAFNIRGDMAWDTQCVRGGSAVFGAEAAVLVGNGDGAQTLTRVSAEEIGAAVI